MIYMGSKNRHSKELLEIILKDRNDDQYFVEPFVGGANVIDKVEGLRIGSDINPYLIATLNAASNGWLPKDDYNETQYKFIRDNKDWNPVLTGYFGFQLSFGGKFFGGWCRNSKGTNYVKNGYNNAIKQFPRLVGVDFRCCSYDELSIPKQSIIYCDPPYANTTKYRNNFDHNKFWEWCEEKNREGHTIFVSEYSAPDDWRCVWKKEVKVTLKKDTNNQRAVERLFTK